MKREVIAHVVAIVMLLVQFLGLYILQKNNIRAPQIAVVFSILLDWPIFKMIQGGNCEYKR